VGGYKVKIFEQVGGRATDLETEINRWLAMEGAGVEVAKMAVTDSKVPHQNVSNAPLVDARVRTVTLLYLKGNS